MVGPVGWFVGLVDGIFDGVSVGSVDKLLGMVVDEDNKSWVVLKISVTLWPTMSLTTLKKSINNTVTDEDMICKGDAAELTLKGCCESGIKG